ncbi:hypothetical protein BW900_31740, partial [Bacillus mycoides]
MRYILFYFIFAPEPDLVKEVTLLKYQFELMKRMIQSDEYPFFMFVIDHEFEEEQVNALLKVLF